MISYIASYFASDFEFRKVIREIPYGNFLVESRYKEEGEYYICVKIDTKEKLKNLVNSDPGNIYIAPKESVLNALDPAIIDAYEGMLLDAPHDNKLLIVAPVDDTLPWSAYLGWSSKKNAWIVS